jgi:hypothetical protein
MITGKRLHANVDPWPEDANPGQCQQCRGNNSYPMRRDGQASAVPGGHVGAGLGAPNQVQEILYDTSPCPKN